jgi:membrane-bound ClpP family serine protease
MTKGFFSKLPKFSSYGFSHENLLKEALYKAKLIINPWGVAYFLGFHYSQTQCYLIAKSGRNQYNEFGFAALTKEGYGMNVLLDPNVAYFLLIGGLVLAVIAVFTPGTGLIELGALFAISLAIYGLVNLPVNSWAITLVILGFVPFFFAGKIKCRKFLVPVSSILILVGSLFIFRKEADLADLNLPLIGVIAVIAASLLWLFAIKGAEVIKKPICINLDELIGREALAVTDIQEEGTIFLRGENWSARSKVKIPRGAPLRVTARKGLIMLVEPVVEPVTGVDKVP